MLKKAIIGLLVKEYENSQALAGRFRRACTDESIKAKLIPNTRNSVIEFSKNRTDKQEADIYKVIFDVKKYRGFLR